MEYMEIIGVPAVVSARYRIVIDKSIRLLYHMSENARVYMRRKRNLLFLTRSNYSRSLDIQQKELSIGRFNLPVDWARSNHIQIGDYVYLVATTEGIIICPAGVKFLCVKGEKNR